MSGVPVSNLTLNSTLFTFFVENTSCDKDNLAGFVVGSFSSVVATAAEPLLSLFVVALTVVSIAVKL